MGPFFKMRKFRNQQIEAQALFTFYFKFCVRTS